MLNVLTAKTDMSSSLFKLMKMGIFFLVKFAQNRLFLSLKFEAFPFIPKLK